MLKQLRKKFIALNMATVTVVVLIVLCAIGITSYQQSINRVYSALNESLDQATRNNPTALFDGFRKGPDALFDKPEGLPFSNYPEKNENGPQADEQFPNMPQLGIAGNKVIPVAVYQISDDLEATLISRITTASLPDDLLEESIDSAMASDSQKGQLASSGLFFSKRTTEEATYIAFADPSSASGWQSLTIALMGIGITSLAIFFVISLFFSKWALKPVDEAWSKQQQFIADASHELKTPITVILANMSILLKHPQESIASQSQWLESTQREAKGMQDLVTDMLDLAKSENAQAKIAHEPVDFSDLTEASALQFESVAFERQILVEEDICEGIVVSGEKAQLDRLIAILLDNALKYAQANTTVRLGMKKGDINHFRNAKDLFVSGSIPKGNCTILSVSNQGSPIDSADLPHLFDRFYRSDKARVRTEGSYGLGLAIAAGITHAHDGCIAVRSAKEGETTFFVALPLS